MGKISDTMCLSSSMEDYLEAISMLKKDKGVARVRDIGRLMRVKNPSVSGALGVLAKDGLIVHERYGYVELTAQGEQIAKRIKRRHEMLIRFLTKVLDINREVASEDACKMEHAISAQTFEKLNKFIEFVESSPEKRPIWLQGFDYYFRTGRRPKCRLRR